MAEAYAKYLRVAEHAAREAGALLRQAFGRVAAREKGPSDLVTDADLESQRTIANILSRAFPDHTLLAEEEGVVPDVSKPWRWIVDPLDGTINFAHGLPLWCVSIALEHRGQLVVGVVHEPLTGRTHSASIGQGATTDGRPVAVSKAHRLGDSLISAAMPTAFTADAARQLAIMGRFSSGTHSVRRSGTSAWNLAMTASGAFDVCYATSMNPWDAAAGVVLVREAGGTVTGLWGDPYDLYKENILATNGLVHEEAVSAVEEVCSSLRSG